MNSLQTSRPKRSSFSFWLFIVSIIGLGVYSLVSLRTTGTIYDGVLAMEAQANNGSVARVTLPENSKPLNIPDWTLFQTGNIWSLTSRDHPLKSDFIVPNLVDTAMAHGDSSQPMKVQKQIESPLKSLFDAAEKDGVELMLSSAYRSVSDQEALYKSFVAKQGAEMAALYVAKPGTSEHHTGLSVDFASASSACEKNSDSCSLSQAASAWLQEHAAAYGFIQRYPEGKQPITGVAFEPWHYRYVGVTMAREVSVSNLTYDEVVRQIAPGYANVLRQP